MLRRLRRLKISLATKCQLLFGVAAGIIILAALVVTWQRIEQLTYQQDTVAAETLAKQTLGMHAATGRLTPQEPAMDEYDGLQVRRPRLVGSDAAENMTPFEAKAFARFTRDPGQTTYGEAYENDAGRQGYLFAMSVRLEARCTSCHTADGDSDLAGIAARSAGVGSSAATRVGEGSDVPGAQDDQDLTSSPPPVMGLVSVEIPSQIKTRQRLLNRAFLITASLVAAATATVTLYFILTRLILYPMRVLQETAEKVREGDLNIRCDISSGDEFQTLSETFNAMLAVVQERNEQLRRANISLDQRLGQLATTNVALDESNRLKSEFLASVSHELRTPLNSILGFADLLKEAGRDNPKIVRFAYNIRSSGSNLLDLINDLLDLAKIEAGRMEVHDDTLSLADTFEAQVTLLGPLASTKQVRIDTHISPDVPLIRTDAGKLQQILFNLLSNAIKFSPTGGRIALDAVREAEQYIRISVADQGPGIAPEMQQRIFEKFRQLDAGVTRQHGGTGLGLAISRDLAHLLGGRISVVSAPGQGATFSLTLPLANPQPSDEARSSVPAAARS
jgi:signal transduction histidine kinase